MRIALVILSMGLLAGCTRGDTRLLGQWRSNRDATVAAALQQDPRWRQLPPEKFERFRDMFGDMTLTYSDGMVTTIYHGKQDSFRYRVVSRGSDFVVIRTETPLMDKDRDIRIRFVDGGASYWVDTGPLGNDLQERFDRVTTGTGVNK